MIQDQVLFKVRSTHAKPRQREPNAPNLRPSTHTVAPATCTPARSLTILTGACRLFVLQSVPFRGFEPPCPTPDRRACRIRSQHRALGRAARGSQTQTSPLDPPNDPVDLPEPQLPLPLRPPALDQRVPELGVQRRDPRLLRPLAVFDPRQHADEVLDLLRFEQEVLGQFALRGGECGGGVGALVGWACGGFRLVLLGGGLVVAGVGVGVAVGVVALGVGRGWGGEGGGVVVEG